MRKISKFLLAGVLLLTGFLGITNTRNEVKEVDAAAGGTVTLKLSSTYWGQASAYYSIHYWGGETSTSWPGNKFNGGKSASGNAEITANYDETSTHCIIIRWSSSSYSTEWNRWDYFDSNTMGETYNYFTNNGWTSCSSSYVASEVEKEEYTISFFHGETNIGSETYIEGDTFNSKFIEREGYKFEGWYKDSSLTTEFTAGTEITSNMSLYGKYVEAEDYKLYFDDNNIFGDTVYAYMYSDDGRTNSSWPGESLTKNEDGKYEVNIDVSKGFNHIIFGNGQDEYVNSVKNENWAQTANLDLSSTVEGDTFVLGAKDTSGKYTATVEAAAAKPALSIAVTPVENAGIKFYAGFPSEYADQINNENVGFKFVFSGEGVETKTGYYVCESTTQTITNIVDGEPVTLNAADAGYAFYFGVIVENIPEGYTSVEVTPAYQHTYHGTVLLEAKTLDFTVVDGVVNF